ncbi:MAG: efflux RND transporter periplasmic adaptor subunit [Treponema sp.]|jgi:multidrug efflux pump subunit AcrA (membrane-fusion protein)|nr:efflux RND transporter periplasmic adaptor subunit [Treponema sp.]
MIKIFSHRQTGSKAGLIFLLLIISALCGCEQVKGIFNKKDAAKESAIEVPVFAVNTTLAIQGQIQDYIALSGDIWAGSTVDAYSDAIGKITRIFVAVGGRVTRGDPIATVDPSRPGMTFRESTVSAPISGTIVALPAQVGMTISQAVPLARIASRGALEIRLNVAERFISRIALNQPCEITLDAWPGEIFRGTISEISPTVDPASRTMEVRINVVNADSKLKPGMFAKVRVITERKNNIVKIPASAVISRFGEQYVYIIEKDPQDPNINIVKKRVITPGILIDSVMEITKGLTVNEELVIRGQTLLDDGSRVNIIERVMPLGE